MSVSPLPVPPSASADATNRAARTFLWGLATDVAIAVLPIAYDAVSHVDSVGTRQYWTLVGVSLGKTAAMTALSYVMRRLKPPTV